MFSLAFDPKRRIMTITGEGLWTLATLTRFSAEVLAYGMVQRARYGPFAVLNDVRRMPVQSAHVTSGLEVVIARGRAIATAPIAAVVSGVLPKLQVERILRGDHSRVFLSMDEAEGWLAERWTP